MFSASATGSHRDPIAAISAILHPALRIAGALYVAVALMLIAARPALERALVSAEGWQKREQ